MLSEMIPSWSKLEGQIKYLSYFSLHKVHVSNSISKLILHLICPSRLCGVRGGGGGTGFTDFHVSFLLTNNEICT